MYRLYSNNVYGSTNDTAFSNKRGGFYNMGIDLRFYQKIYKNFIAAVRVAGAHSGGNQKILYFLGGVDNALNPDYSDALQPSGKNDYAFQALATNLRGYSQNARNGNTYAVINAELRFPVLSTLMRRPIQSAILKHLQVVAFADIGSAWEGLLPNSESFDRYFRVGWPTATNPTIGVAVPNYSDNGIAIGYGAGLRSQIFGYFVRVDAALNLNRDFSYYISLGTDF
jgi:outer membrane protein assembly factor BamA